jgi:hypothetical protein
MARMCFGGPCRSLERPILAVRGQRRRSGSPLIYEIKWHGCESERNCGRRGAKFADGSRWAPRTPERRAAARAFDGPRQGPPGRGDQSPVQLSGGSPRSSGSMPGPEPGSGVRPRPGHLGPAPASLSLPLPQESRPRWHPGQPNGRLNSQFFLRVSHWHLLCPVEDYVIGAVVAGTEAGLRSRDSHAVHFGHALLDGSNCLRQSRLALRAAQFPGLASCDKIGARRG